MSKTVLITGCSTGMGRLAAFTFQEKGWNVVATMRRPENETELNALENTLVLALDVTDQSSINDAISQAIDNFGTIDVLVNNAGYGGHAALEQSSDESVRAMFDTNVFGVFNTTRAVMPILRKQGAGVVINVTSMGWDDRHPSRDILLRFEMGRRGLHRGFSDGVSVILVSRCVQCFRVPTRLPSTGTYRDNLETGDTQVVEHAQKIRAHFGAIVADHHGSEQTADAQEVADLIYRCAIEDMPVHNPCGTDAQMLVGLSQSPGRQVFYDNLTGLLLPAPPA